MHAVSKFYFVALPCGFSCLVLRVGLMYLCYGVFLCPFLQGIWKDMSI